MFRREVMRKAVGVPGRRRCHSLQAWCHVVIQGADSNASAAAQADTLIFCVKPQDLEVTLKEIRHEIKQETLVISVAASVTTRFIEQHPDAGVPVVRAMPNTPCLLRVGITALAAGHHADDNHLRLAETSIAASPCTCLKIVSG